MTNFFLNFTKDSTSETNVELKETLSTFCDKQKIPFLTSSEWDCKKFPIPKSYGNSSVLITNVLKYGSTDVVTIPELSSHLTPLLYVYLHSNKGELGLNDFKTTARNLEFIQLFNKQVVYDLLNTADFLHIKSLRSLCLQQISTWLQGLPIERYSNALRTNFSSQKQKKTLLLNSDPMEIDGSSEKLKKETEFKGLAAKKEKETSISHSEMQKKVKSWAGEEKNLYDTMYETIHGELKKYLQNSTEHTKELLSLLFPFESEEEKKEIVLISISFTCEQCTHEGLGYVTNGTCKRCGDDSYHCFDGHSLPFSMTLNEEKIITLISTRECCKRIGYISPKLYIVGFVTETKMIFFGDDVESSSYQNKNVFKFTITCETSKVSTLTSEVMITSKRDLQLF